MKDDGFQSQISRRAGVGGGALVVKLGGQWVAQSFKL